MTDSNVDALQEAGFGSTTKCPRLRSCEIGPSCDFDSGSETHKHHKAQGGAGGYVSVVARVPPKFDTIGVCVGGGGVAGWIITDVHGISEDPHFLRLTSSKTYQGLISKNGNPHEIFPNFH